MKTASLILLLPLFFTSCAAFAPPSASVSASASALLKNNNSNRPILLLQAQADNINNADNNINSITQTQESRRRILQKSLSSLPILALLTTAITSNPAPSHAISGAMDQTNSAPDFVQKYEDFTKTAEGWQFKDAKIGSGDVGLEVGDRAVFAWSGYTIGYFGRPFEAKGGPVGGAFDKDLDFSRTVIGSGTLVPGLEKALVDMKPGGIRQVLVPYGPLSYPPEDLEHVKVGPKPTTFSGQRALNFVLENPRVDRTLLFNVKLVRIDKSDRKGGFIRG